MWESTQLSQISNYSRRLQSMARYWLYRVLKIRVQLSPQSMVKSSIWSHPHCGIRTFSCKWISQKAFKRSRHMIMRTISSLIWLSTKLCSQMTLGTLSSSLLKARSTSSSRTLVSLKLTQRRYIGRYSLSITGWHLSKSKSSEAAQTKTGNWWYQS